MQADPNVDIVLLQEALPREPGSDRAESYIRMVERLRGHQGEEADRLRDADLARPDRLQPRAARQGAACVVPAGGQQGAARDRQRRAARRDRAARVARPATTGRADARAARRRSRRLRGARAREATGAQRGATRRTCCAPTASRRRRRRWSTSPRGRASQAADAHRLSRSCSRRCPTRSRTSPTSARSRSILRRRRRSTRGLRRAWRSKLREHVLAGMLVCQQVRGGLELVLGPAPRSRNGPGGDGRRAAACCSN